MPHWLPWALFALLGLLMAVMPWKRPHPNHQFMLEQWSRLRDDCAGRILTREHTDAAGHHHGSGSAHV
jgi:hypothetical protein